MATSIHVFRTLAIFSLLCICQAVPKLLLISLDGFRYDYLEKFDAPNLINFAKKGVRATKGMIPAFPSVTFPNHNTLVTGLHPESHGIIYNVMYDPEFNETFMYGNDSKWWNEATPAWITATENGIKSGVSFWPGSTVVFNNKTADVFRGYESNKTFEPRVDEVVDWLVNQNVTFAVAYFEEPDSSGHQFGTESIEVKNKVKQMDDLMGYLFAKLDDKRLLANTNIIILSDHGMVNASQDDDVVLILEQYLNPQDYVKVAHFGVVAGILPAEGQETNVYNKLKGKKSYVDVYYKKDIPQRFHFQNNRRIMPIIAIAQEGHFIVEKESDIKKKIQGIHGYDNQIVNMRPIFLASGPSFKQNSQLEPFENVNVYSLVCHLLGIEPLPNNGSLDVFKNVLNPSDSGLSDLKPQDPSSGSSSMQHSFINNFIIFCIIFTTGAINIVTV